MTNAHSAGNTITCPRCRRRANIVSGTFSATHDKLEIVSAPPLTHAVINRLREIAEQAKRGEISEAEAFNQAKEVAPPELKKWFDLFLSAGIPILSILISLIALYVAYADSASSDKFDAEALELLQEQTSIMRLAQQGEHKVEDHSVDDQGAGPADPKTDPKAVTAKVKGKPKTDAKPKSNRRSAVRKERKRQLVQQRLDSGRNYRAARKGDHTGKGKRK